jgi:hypothetical protein
MHDLAGRYRGFMLKLSLSAEVKLSCNAFAALPCPNSGIVPPLHRSPPPIATNGRMGYRRTLIWGRSRSGDHSLRGKTDPRKAGSRFTVESRSFFLRMRNMPTTFFRPSLLAGGSPAGPCRLSFLFHSVVGYFEKMVEFIVRGC